MVLAVLRFNFQCVLVILHVVHVYIRLTGRVSFTNKHDK